ncbi:hypothetical protein KSF73_10175 [Burkholderiaceae bacterium DAT-1]|nr:hypothetical protein [Burkholderiaceae bacterium DAT-1]
MFDQRTSGRRLVRWRTAIISTDGDPTIIPGHVTEVSAKGLALFCDKQLYPNKVYRIVLQIPDPLHVGVTYVEVYGKPTYSSLVGPMGQFRTGMKLTEISNDYKTRIDQMLRNSG